MSSLNPSAYFRPVRYTLSRISTVTSSPVLVLAFSINPFVMVQREMEKPGLGNKVVNTRTDSLDLPLSYQSRRGRQGGIVPPPFGLGPRVGARVVSPRSPILRPGHQSS